MTPSSLTALLDLVGARPGHFRLESGLHSRVWLDLDALFADGRAIAPLVRQLGSAIAPHRVDAVCGPLLGGAFLAQLVSRDLGIEFWHAERSGDAEPAGLFPARYALPPSLARRAEGRRVALVDDVMSAGSSLRSTCAELRAHGAECVVAGALLVLGNVGSEWFLAQGVPVEAVLRHDFETWAPGACPLCGAGVAEDLTPSVTR